MNFDDIREIYEYYRKVNIPYIIRLYKNYTLYNKDRAPYIDDWQANLKSGITMFFTDTMYNAVQDNDVRFIVAGRKLEGNKVAQDILEWIEYVYTRDTSDTALYDAIKEGVLTGTGWTKVGYRYKENKIDGVDKRGKEIKGTYVEDYPTLNYKSGLSVMVDKSARDIDDARFVVERIILPVSQIETYYSVYNIKYSNHSAENSIYVDSTDYERMKRDMFMSSSRVGMTDFRDDVYEIVKDKTVEIFELREPGYVTIFIGGKQFGRYKQIGPWKKCPYRPINFISMPNSIESIGVGTVVESTQEVYDAILNSRMDNVRLAGNKVFIHDMALDNILNDVEYLDLQPGKVIHVRGEGALKELPISDIKQGPIVESENLLQLTQETLGASGYQLGVQQKVERSAYGVEVLENSANNRLKPLMKSISNTMSFIAKYWLVLSVSMTDEETFDRVLGEDNELKNMNVIDIINDVDFEFNMTSQKVKSTSQRLQQALQLLQFTEGLVDSAGNPIIDKKPIAEFILEGLGLSEDVLQDKDSIMEEIATHMEIQQAAQGLQAGPGVLQPEQGGAPAGGAANQTGLPNQQPETNADLSSQLGGIV